jgi:hypothetical protein
MSQYTSARWANDEHIGVLLISDSGPSLFVDSGSLYEKALSGEFGVLSEPIVEGVSAEAVRDTRDELLASSDWTQVPDAPVDQAAWAVYRKALRDVPEQEGFPSEIAWPAQP